MPSLAPPWVGSGGGSAKPASSGGGAGALGEGGGDKGAGVPKTDAKPKATYGKAIVIEGDAEFQKKVKADLDAIAKTPSGKKMLDDLDKSGKTVTIKPTTEGNSVTGLSGGAMKKDGKNGTGSNSTVNYNPDRKSIGDEKWETRPPAIGLAHELVHAQHASEGSIDMTKVDNDSKPDPSDPKKTEKESLEEVRTAGIPPNDKDAYNENKIRGEWDPKQPERKWY